jgi:hypothetical protein
MQCQLEELEKEYGIEWREYELSCFFEIQNTLSFNKDKLTSGSEYDYVTRTSQNQGILQKTGFVNQENINQAGTWSLGLLQMDFFYRQRAWYAGQFVRKIVPKIKLTKSTVLYFTALLNKQKKNLLSGLVRDVDEAFLTAKMSFPTRNSQIAFDFIEKFIATLNAERFATLNAYLTTTNLKNYTLTEAEQTALDRLDAVKWGEFSIIDLFSVKNTHCILSRDIVANSGCIPYLTAGQTNNSVGTYINFDKSQIDEGNCVFIGGKTFVVTYQENNFFSNDSHNLALYYKDSDKRTKNNQLFMLTSIYKSLSPLYSWGDSISNKKIQKDKIKLPIKPDNTPDYDYMTLVISAMQKVVIKNVVLYADKKLAASKQIVDVKQTLLKNSDIS